MRSAQNRFSQSAFRNSDVAPMDDSGVVGALFTPDKTRVLNYRIAYLDTPIPVAAGGVRIKLMKINVDTLVITPIPGAEWSTVLGDPGATPLMGYRDFPIDVVIESNEAVMGTFEKVAPGVVCASIYSDLTGEF